MTLEHVGRFHREEEGHRWWQTCRFRSKVLRKRENSRPLPTNMFFFGSSELMKEEFGLVGVRAEIVEEREQKGQTREVALTLRRVPAHPSLFPLSLSFRRRKLASFYFQLALMNNQRASTERRSILLPVGFILRL